MTQENLTGLDSRLADRIANLSEVKRAMLIERLRKTGMAQPDRIPRREDGQEEIPLSFAQERLWFVSQLEVESAFYNEIGAVALAGRLDVQVLERSLQEIIRRHEILRTRFVIVNGHVRQQILPEVWIAIRQENLQMLSADQQTAAVQQWLIDETNRSFDLSSDSLIRFSLLQLAAEQYILVVGLHHIIADEWSINILIEEFSSLYSALREGRPSPLPELPIQYADYACWQQRRLQREVLHKQLDYWTRQLMNRPSLLELPTDFPRPKKLQHTGAKYHFRIPSETAAAVLQLGNRHGATLFMTLATAYAVLLSRYTHQYDLCIGYPIANRSCSELHQLIGFFANTLVLRVNLSGNPTFLDVLHDVREACLAAQEHQDLPFEQLVKELAPERDLSHNPLFQVFLSLTTVQAMPRMSGMELTEVNVETGQSKFDVTLDIHEKNGELTGWFEYNTELFKESTIARWAAHYQQLLLNICAAADERLAALSILREKERQQVLYEWNATDQRLPDNQCVHQFIEQQAARCPDAVAISSVDESVTYHMLNAKANQLAHYLRAQGIGAEARIGIYCERSAGMIVALLATLKAGATYVPIDSRHLAEHIAQMLEDAKLQIILTQKSLQKVLPRTARIVCLDVPSREMEAHSRNNPCIDVHPSNLAYVIYTSGSTGRPKGVGVTHRNLLHATVARQTYYQIPVTGFLLLSSIAFDSSVAGIFGTLCQGGKLVLPSEEDIFDPSKLVRLISEQQISHLLTVPSLYEMIVQYMTAESGESLKEAIVAGESCKKSLVQLHYNRLPATQLFNEYGPTEATVWSSVHACTLDDHPEVPIGRPIANTRIYLLDQNLNPVPVGVTGELYIGGEGVARGYLDQPGITADCYLPDPFSGSGNRIYRTGDLARFRDDGRIEYVGRTDHQVKIRGFRIELGEIESILLQNAFITAAVVVAREDTPGNKRLVAYVAGDTTVLNEADIRASLAEKLPDYMRPAAIVLVDRLPVGPNGKVDRKKLPEPSLHAQITGLFQQPTTSTEQIVAAIWTEVLALTDVQVIGANDNFFELGGHSLLIVQVISRVRDLLAIELPLRVLFEKPVLAEFAREIDALETEGKRAGDVLHYFYCDVRIQTGPLPLSYGQERLWFLDQFEPGGSSYSMPGAVRLRGELDVDVLVMSLNEIIRRHEILRTTFTANDGEPEQIIAPSLELDLRRIDLQAVPGGEREQQIQRCLEVDAQQPFELLSGPLVRASLLCLGEAEHILQFTLHHIVADGWSTAILIREFVTLYEAYRAGRASPLPELTIQYADYAIWQRQWLQGERLERQVNYWKQQLSAAPAVLELPTDRPRPAVQSYRGATLYASVPQPLADQLKQLARQQEATLFMVLLAAFNIVLSRYSGQTDVCVGTPMANRNRLEIEGLIGFFVNTLVLRSDLSGNPTFLELLKRVKEICLGAQAHQDLPFEKLVEELSPVRDMSHNPLFQVMLALQNTPDAALAITGLTITPEVMEVGTSKFDLDLEISESEQGLEIQYSYNTDLFDRATIERLAQHYGVLLEGIAKAPQRFISELPFLTQAERDQLLIEWNGATVPYPAQSCIHQLFEAHAASNPDAVAVVFEGGQLSYGDLDRKANQLAHFLRSEGIGADIVVGLCVERSLDMMAGILGILKAGGSYVPLDPELPPGKLRQILMDANVGWVMTSSTLATRIPKSCRTLYLDQDIRADYSASAVSGAVVDPQQLAYMLYTSGTTGVAKAVGVTHANLVNQYHAWESTYELDKTDVHLQMARYTFDVFAGDWIRALCSGGKLVICPRETLLQPAELYALMQRAQVTVAEFVPAVLRALADYLDDTCEDLSFMRLLICGSDRWYAEEYKAFQKRCGEATRVINSYGLTETTIDSSYFESPANALLTGDVVPIGRQFANTRSYILDPWLNPVPIGATGELYIGGSGVARGYFNRSELTAERFIPDPFSEHGGARLYKTGDVVRYLPDGNMAHLGRLDHQVKIRGLRIELGEIESALLQHPHISEAVVIAQEEGATGNQRLVAYVVANEAELELDAVRLYLKDYLVDYMIPTTMLLLEHMPLSANGKIDRQALPQADDREYNPDRYVAPRTPTEELIAAIWADVLKLDKVGIHDNFFQLGGHSLLAMTLTERIRRHGLRADVRSLFITQTLAEFVAALNQPAAVEVPDNCIPAHCQHITPDMLPLAALTQAEIDRIVSRVPGGTENIQDIYPLTPFQEGILFHHLISPDGDPYVLSSLLAFVTRNQLDRFLKALQTVINRHDILRTAVLWEELSAPVQVVLRNVDLPVTEMSLNPAFGDAAAQMQAQFDPRRFRLDIRQAPLLQGHIAWDEQHAQWLLMMLEHHLALDHVAMETVLKEVRLLLLDQPEQLSQPLPFRSFVAHTRLGMKPEQHETFFRSLLGQVDEPTAPFGLLNVQGDGSDSVEAFIDLDEALHQRIRSCAQSVSVSPASVFHLAWAQVLALLCGQETIVFGTVLLGRAQLADEADRMLGMFINTLPVCFDINTIGTRAALQKMHQLLAELMRHEHASLALAQRCSAVPMPAPLFSTLLNYRHSAGEDSNAAETSAAFWKELGISVLKEDERTNYPFTLSVDDYGNGFRLTMQVQPPAEPQRILGYLLSALTRLTDALTAQPDKAFCAIEVLPEAEKTQLLLDWNAITTHCLQDYCIHELFEQCVEKHPDAIAITYESISLTYGDLNAQANRVAYDLKARGVGPEVLVGLLFERSVDMIIGMVAILKAGGAYLPIDPRYPHERIAFMIEDAKPTVILTHSDLSGLLPAGLGILCLDRAEFSDQRYDNPTSGATADNLAYVIYTSGSTGTPKGVMVSHQNVRRLFAVTEQEYHFGCDDVWTFFHSYAFDFSVWEMWGALLYGGRLIVVPDAVRHSPEAFHQLLLDQQVTILNQTPTSFYQLDATDKRALSTHPLALRLIIFGGEALELGQLQKWFDRHGDERPQLVNMYGITETTIHVTWAPLTLADAHSSGNSTVGRPLADLQAFILDGHGNPAPCGVPGELFVGGAGLARGYLNRPDLTADRFVPHPFSESAGARLYRTGDLARYREHGDIEYLGRIDQQVKIRGFRIEMGEIENLLLQHPLINEAVVVARSNSASDSGSEKRLVAYVASDELCRMVTAVDTLRSYLQQRLPDYMIPAAFVFLDALPLTSNGKVDRKALPEPDIAAQLSTRYAAPRNALEQILVDVWEKVLQLESVGIDDNFFTLGGDSIRSIQVVGIAKERGVKLPMELLYQCGTIRTLAQILSDAPAESSSIDVIEPFALMTVDDLSKLPGTIEDAYPMTAMQAGMIFHSEQQAGAYHVIDNVTLQCKLDPAAFRTALEYVVARHPILRTTFDLGSFSEPLQLVHRQGVISLRVEDLSHVPETQQQKLLAAHDQRLSSEYFTVTSLPLLKFSIHYLGDDQLQLSVAAHHAILDGWSLVSLLIEIFHQYFAIQPGKQFSHAQLPNAMRELVMRERQALASGNDRAFWARWMSEATLNSFPQWVPASSDVQPQHDEWPEIELRVPEGYTEKLQQLAQSRGMPLKSILLAAHVRVIGLLHGETSITTGLVTSVRPEGCDSDQALGVFLNTLPFSIRLQGETWEQLIDRVFGLEQAMLKARYYPVAELQRLKGCRPLFETTFNFLHYHIGKDIIGSDQVQVIEWHNPIRPNFALETTFNLEIDTDEIALTLQGDPSRLDQAQLQRIAHYYLSSLSAIANESWQRCDNNNLLSQIELKQLLDWNDTQASYPHGQCIHQLFEAQVLRNPHAIAISYENEQLSYGQLNKKANQLAHYLKNYQIEPEVIVGICLERSLEMVIGLLGVLKAGGAYLPIDPDHPRDRIAAIVNEAQPAVILAHAATRPALPDGLEIIDLEADDILISKFGEENPYSSIQVQNLAYVMYTSGSTGKPKGSALAHQGIVNRLAWMQKQYQLTDQDRVLQKTPFSFDVSVWEFFWPLMVGAELVVLAPDAHKDSSRLIEKIDQAQISVVHFVPSMLAVFLEAAAQSSCPSLRLVFCSGEALPLAVVEKFREKIPAKLHNLYGPTEASVDVTYWPCEQHNPGLSVPIGHPIDNIQIYLLDPHFQPVPIGVTGELYIGGIGLARGYLNRPDLTAERFVPDPFGTAGRLYRTGDLARYRADGNIDYIGRSDYQVKIRGLRIELGEIEAVLMQHGDIREAVAVVRENTPGNKQLIAYLVSNSGIDLDREALKLFLKARLPEYMLPTTFISIDHLPLSANGKLDRAALPAPALEHPSTQFVAPRTPTEEALVGLWAEVLGLEQVGIQDDFFELGGHSLLAAQLMARIRLAFGIDLPLSVLLDSATIAGMSPAVEQAIIHSIEQLTESEAEYLLEMERK